MQSLGTSAHAHAGRDFRSHPAQEQKFGENMPPGTRKLVEDGKAEIHRRIAERAKQTRHEEDDDGA